jgi:transketolase
MVVLNPADPIEARLCVKAAIDHDGPVYLRFGRMAVDSIFDENYKFEIGKGAVLREGKDVAIVATGLMVARALEAADLLKEEGIDATVINMASIKPLDNDMVIKYAEKCGAIAAAQDGIVDDVIEAKETRKYIIAALELLATKHDVNLPKKHGNLPL